jgi:hypothetical protein
MRLRGAISARLMEILHRGRERLGRESLDMIRGFVASQHTDDIYYTLFHWTLIRLLGMNSDPSEMARRLEGLDPEKMDRVHRAAYTRCVMLQKMARWGLPGALWHLLTHGGGETGPAKSGNLPAETPDSPYEMFMQLSMAEDSGRRIGDRRQFARRLEAWRVAGGGYANTPGAEVATTNATAAALIVSGQLRGYRKSPDSHYLRRLQQPSGGFASSPEAPAPDLLSTATALFTLRQYGERPEYPAADFIEAHWLPSGGFAATLLDDGSDVEYTFYGLLALGAS